MSDPALHESTALPPLADARPPSDGRSSSHGAETQQTDVSDELKARLDKVIYSDVREHEYFAGNKWGEEAGILIVTVADWHNYPLDSIEAKRGLCQGKESQKVQATIANG